MIGTNYNGKGERMADKVTYDAGSISVLEGLEAVRKRPGMYIGSVSRKGLNHLIYEIVDNAVDEHLAGACSEIKVTLEADGSCTVEDNGRGIPVGMHEKGVPAARLVFSTLHADKRRFARCWIFRSKRIVHLSGCTDQPGRCDPS